MALLILGLLLFVGTHSIYIVAPGVRQLAIDRIGYNPWRGVFSLASFAGIFAIAVGYGEARLDPVFVWEPPAWTAHLVMTVMVVAFPMLVAAFVPCRIRAALQHPMLASVKVWAFAHLLGNGTVADLLLFGVILVWAIAARVTLKRRPMNPAPAAVRRGWAGDVLAVGLGLAFYVAFLFGLHGLLIGVPLL